MNTYLSLERAFEEVLGMAQVDGRGVDYQAGIVFAYAMLSGTFYHSLVPSNVSNRYHTLLKSQQRYVARLIREGSSYAEDAKSRKAQGHVQNVFYTSGRGTEVRQNLLASMKGAGALHRELESRGFDYRAGWGWRIQD